jgi:hypothetical protein
MEGATQKLHQWHDPLSLRDAKPAFFLERAVWRVKKKGGTRPPFRERVALFRIHKMAAPVLLPALLVVFGTERLLFAVANGLHAIG